MPTPELVERVARALAKFGWSVENPVFDDWFIRPEIQKAYLEQAQAALKAHEEWLQAHNMKIMTVREVSWVPFTIDDDPR